ncbi:hypothetical protein CHUAL_004457 [Chamberlinius hualienensis]
MAFLGRQMCASARCVMVAARRTFLTTSKPAVTSTCSLFGVSSRNTPIAARSYYLLSKYCSKPVSCPCGTCNGLHTKGDKELVEFLTEEISAETKAQKSSKLPKIEGFDVSTDKATINLTRKFNNENVKVTLNVNHTVDADVDDADVSPSQEKVPDGSEMKSKPNFTVSVEKEGKFLEFGCSIIQQGFEPEEANPESEAYDDVFNIDEVAIYDKDRTDQVYAVSGEIMDGYLYDLLMNYLEERGISNQFAEKLIEYATAYEHKQYISLLENVKSFLTSN